MLCKQHDGSFSLDVHVYAAAILGNTKKEHNKSQKQVIFIVYIWRLQVYHVCINLLLQQQNANVEEFSSGRRKADKEEEEYVIDLTIKPLNREITTQTSDDDARSENCLNTRFIIVKEGGSAADGFAQLETWK